MKLKEAMQYRGETAESLGRRLRVTEDGCEVELYGGCNERGKTHQQEAV